jgi:hypothetical protein
MTTKARKVAGGAPFAARRAGYQRSLAMTELRMRLGYDFS